ncbi:MAG: hypothetical protein A3G76_16865 [Acidobacteria bacterium RIFCSPLOWO2_12_FULL_65_11]|nr:MAG: hypothetical protein A3H95_12015 [Acidobacteria bacterium RIFCSPLOWO2_02_FULL_64_15]OFW34490.1 MAG: hypothetical protein A3G76_16865 [Acidobacteria bacterium RIFCSPLOWO2_12_FULL_65_11]
MRSVQHVQRVLVFLAAIVCGGCFHFQTVITLNGDGSGTVNERVLFTSAALAQIRQFTALAGGGVP